MVTSFYWMEEEASNNTLKMYVSGNIDDGLLFPTKEGGFSQRWEKIW